MNGNVKNEKKTAKTFQILASLVLGNLFLGSCYSLMAPIYPEEAEKKKMSASVCGMVFGAYQLVMFISAPIYGKLITFLKPGCLIKFGMMVSGICSILFSFLDSVPPGIPFTGLSIIIRSVDALGASAFFTASYATIGCELPEIIGRAMSIVETAFSVGLAIGPVIGGVLYQYGGFSLPFRVMGVLLLVCTAINMLLFDNTDNITVQQISTWKLVKNTDFLIDLVAILSCFAMLGFTEATLEPHIRQFNLTPTLVGGIFLIDGLVDALSSPLWGYVAEKVSNAQSLTFIGCLTFIIGYLIVGPAPFFNFPTSLTLIIVSQLLFGLGMAIQIVSSFTHAMKHTVERGFPADVGTYGLISGILFSSACFGSFLGPSVGGILIDQMGYRSATLVIVAMEITIATICGTRLCFLLVKKRKTTPEQTLLKNIYHEYYDT